MTRFWIPIEKVMDIILDTLSFMQGGEIVIPKMKNMPIVDVIALLTPEAKIKTVGMRPGEKLHEVLITEYEAPRTKDLPNAYVVKPEFDKSNFTKWLDKKPSAARDFIFASDNPVFKLSQKEAREILKL
jgi:UDP-N-acetylglucosamine 4,6-dehydratase